MSAVEIRGHEFDNGLVVFTDIALELIEGAEQVFLGRDIGRQHVFSEQTLQDIDDEVKRIVTEQFERARTILEGNRERVETLAAALLAGLLPAWRSTRIQPATALREE